jgi:single-stranded-DNA-specific exonuclease
MDQAVQRLYHAREQQEAVAIFGDYDVDGVTATALLREVMVDLGWKVTCYLPHRLDEGYGLNRDSAANCLRQHPAPLWLAVDCGSTATETISWLKTQNVDVIVIDHHQAASPPPPAVALINPHAGTVPDEAAGVGRELCSVGLAFKLAHALVKRARQQGLAGGEAYDVRLLLDLVALGTIADLVPLTGENRILVSAGLRRLAATRRPGLQALKRVAAVADSPGVYDVAFLLGPRLNAAGRLETASDALSLLLAPTMQAAEPLAQGLETRNRERQQIERKIAQEATTAVRARFQPEQDYVIVEGQAGWHIGVVGIVASRVLREFYRPTLILGGDAELWRGSGRSIEGFDLAAALRACADDLERHGGHAMAAGLALRPERIDSFRRRLNDLARRLLKPEQLQPRLRLDAEVTLHDLHPGITGELDRLQPIGQGNPPVQLSVCGLHLHRPPQRIGREGQHARLWVTDGSRTAEVVWWNVANQPLPEGCFDLAFTPQLNTFGGRTSLQLKAIDWRPASAR